MPVLPDFQPEGRPGEAAQALIEGRNAGESWMSMEQNRQIQAQQAQEEQAKFIAMLPAIHAKAQADVVTANATVGLATRMQQLRTQAGAVANDANNEFLDASQLSDPESKFQELGRIQAKYAWMGNLPEYKPFLDAVDKSRGDAFHMVTANNLADSLLQRTEALVGGRENIVEAQQAGATERTGMTVAGRSEAANTSAQAKIEAEKVRANTPKSYEYETTMNLLQQAVDAGDEARIQRFSARLDKLDHIKMTADEIAADKAAPKAPLPKAGSGTPRQPITFSVPNVTQAAPVEKLYLPPVAPGELPKFAPSVKTPQDVLHAMQQMVDDKVVTAEQARETLTKLGFKPRQ
jgi:hypothetical protein